MRKLIVLILCFSFGVAFSQSTGHKKTPEMKATEIVAKMNEVVGGLSDSQKAELHPVLVIKIKEKRKIKHDSVLSEDEKKEKKKALRKDTKSKVKAIMTDPQWKKWKAYMKEKREEKKNKDGHDDH